MRQEIIEYIKYRTARADESLDAAKLLLENGHLHEAVSQLYYACFCAVSALLHTEGLSSQSHSGILFLFDEHWLRTNRLPTPMGRFYHNIFRLRQRGDYGNRVTFEKEDVRKWLDEARQFVDRISAEIRKQLSETPG